MQEIHLDEPLLPLSNTLSLEAESNMLAFKAAAATKEGELPQR